jgi:hypothetical protein
MIMANGKINASPTAAREAKRLLSRRGMLLPNPSTTTTECSGNSSRSPSPTQQHSKSLRFNLDNNRLHEFEQTLEDIRNAWTSDEEKQEIRRSIDASIDATYRRMEMRGQGLFKTENDEDYCKIDPFNLRGIEHMIDPNVREEKSARGKKIRQAILKAMENSGANAAAKMSIKLTANDVKDAKEKAAKDVDAAVYIYLYAKSKNPAISYMLPIATGDSNNSSTKSGLFSFKRKTRSQDNLQQLIDEEKNNQMDKRKEAAAAASSSSSSSSSLVDNRRMHKEASPLQPIESSSPKPNLFALRRKTKSYGDLQAMATVSC